MQRKILAVHFKCPDHPDSIGLPFLEACEDLSVLSCANAAEFERVLADALRDKGLVLALYGSPAAMIARLEGADSSDSSRETGCNELTAALAAWEAYAAVLLRASVMHPDHCVLINDRVLNAAPERLADLLDQRMGTATATVCVAQADTDDDRLSRVEEELSQGLIGFYPQAEARYRELEAAADLPADDPEILQAQVRSALADARQLHARALDRIECVEQLEQLSARIRELQQTLDALAREKAALSAAHDTLSTEAKQLTAARDTLELEIVEARNALVDAEARSKTERDALLTQRDSELADAREEGELLLLQLHQVQEELERHFLEAQNENEKARQLGDQEKQTLVSERDGLAKAKVASDKQASELKKQLDALEKEIVSVRKALTDRDAQLVQRDSELADAREEGELLLLQLHQVQEELERYFLENQKLRRSVSTQPSEAAYDMREEIKGDNWYRAESDGRWAGPREASTLRLPSLGKGRFVLQLDVADAADAEILRGMTADIDGAPIELVQEWTKLPARIHAVFDAPGDSASEGPLLTLRFPRCISPAEKGAADTRKLAIRLRAIRVARLGADPAKPRPDCLRIADLSRDKETLQAEVDKVRMELAEIQARPRLPGTAPVAALYDLGTPVEGENWYPPEPRAGRWSGPAKNSTVRLPALGEGAYKATFVINSAITPETLDTLSVSLNGRPLMVERTSSRFPVRFEASLESLPDDLAAGWCFGFTIPETASPKALGLGKDVRQLGIQLKAIHITRAETDSVLAPSPSAGTAITEVAFDLRHAIDGENWHDPEPDGRWAGPAKSSTINLPAPRRPGQHLITLEVVDAIESTVVDTLKVSLGGQPLEFSREGKKYPIKLAALVDPEQHRAADLWRLKLDFPSTRSPVELKKGNDARQLALKLRSVRISAIGQSKPDVEVVR